MRTHPGTCLIDHRSWLAPSNVGRQCNAFSGSVRNSAQRPSMSAVPDPARSSRPFEIAHELLDAVGADPTSGIVVIPWSVRELASQYRISPGTMQRHLQVLATAGVKVGARPLRFDAGALAAEKRPALRLITSEEPPAASSGTSFDAETVTPATAATAASAVGALERLGLASLEQGNESAFADVTEALASIARPSSTPLRAREETRDEVREIDAQAAHRSRAPGELSSLSIVRKEEASSFLSGVRDDQRDRNARRAPLPHPVVNGEHPRSRVDLERVLSPLLTLCTEHGLVGLESVAGASEAFSLFDDDRLAYAVRQMVLEVRSRSGGSIERPVGLLIHRALEQPDPDPRFFPRDRVIPRSADHGLARRLFEIDLDLPVEAWPGLVRDLALEWQGQVKRRWLDLDRERLASVGVDSTDLGQLDQSDDDRLRLACLVRVCGGDPEPSAVEVVEPNEPLDVRQLLANARSALSDGSSPAPARSRSAPAEGS